MTWPLIVIAFICFYFASGWATTIVSRSHCDYTKSVFKPFRACFCDNCKIEIEYAVHTFPVIGYLLLRGKSRCCNTKIPIKYTIIEICLMTGQFLLFMLLKFNMWICFAAVTGFYVLAVSAICYAFYGPRLKTRNLMWGLIYSVAVFQCAILAIFVFHNAM